MTSRMFTTRWPDPAPRALWAALSFALLAACAGGADSPVTTEQRGIDAFHSVDLHSAAELQIEVGPATSLSVTAAADALREIETTVTNGMLKIDGGAGWPGGGSREIKVHITMPALNAVAVNGAGDVTIDGAHGGPLALVVQGAGSIRASGDAESLNARVKGAGDMDLSKLVVGDATIVVTGAGHMSSHVTGTLVAEINGAGEIEYGGNPIQVDKRITGAGSIEPIPASN